MSKWEDAAGILIACMATPFVIYGLVLFVKWAWGA